MKNNKLDTMLWFMDFGHAVVRVADLQFLLFYSISEEETQKFKKKFTPWDLIFVSTSCGIKPLNILHNLN